MQQRVLLTGASGFVGSAVVKGLTQSGLSVNALVNRRTLPETGAQVKSIRADLFDPAALDGAMAGCAVAIHLIGIIQENSKKGITFERMHIEATRRVVEAAQRSGVKRFVHMSAMGVRADAETEYGRTKWRAEQIVRESGLDWTIFRPSMIHGPNGEFMKMEAKWARKQSPPFLFMPYFGAGLLGLNAKGRVQPIFVDDVARAFVEAIGNSKSIGRVYELGGADRLTWPMMHRIASQGIVGKQRLTLGIPAWYGKLVAGIVPGSLLPFNRDQVVMSLEDNSGDTGDFVRDFGWQPMGFEPSLRGYAGSI
jgi:uncharacterized protein YbjT (DUF2867 family)